MSDTNMETSRISVAIARDGAERDACFALRYRVYVEEQGRQAPAADHRRRLERNADDETGILFCVRSGDEVVATVRVHHGAVTGLPLCVREAFGLPEAGAAATGEAPAWRTAAGSPDPRQAGVISRLAIDARHRGGQTIVALLRGCMAWFREEGRETRQVYILAFDDPGLVALYGMLGFKPIESRARYMIDLGATVPMVASLAARPAG